MSKTYIAVHRVERRNADGELIAYNPDEAITGFDADEVTRLVEAGAIVEKDVADAVKAAVATATSTPVADAPSAQDAAAAAKTRQSREEMEKRATELGVAFSARLSDDKLAERIVDAEANDLTA